MGDFYCVWNAENKCTAYQQTKNFNQNSNSLFNLIAFGTNGF